MTNDDKKVLATMLANLQEQAASLLIFLKNHSSEDGEMADPAESPAKEYTYEEARAILAEKARSGHRAEVKAIESAGNRHRDLDIKGILLHIPDLHIRTEPVDHLIKDGQPATQGHFLLRPIIHPEYFFCVILDTEAFRFRHPFPGQHLRRLHPVNPVGGYFLPRIRPSHQVIPVAVPDHSVRRYSISLFNGCVTSTGGPYSCKSYIHPLKRSIKEINAQREDAGVRRMPNASFHDLRHTHAAMLIRRNIQPKVISERFGHASIKITMDLYGYLMPGLQDAVAEVFNQEHPQLKVVSAG